MVILTRKMECGGRGGGSCSVMKRICMCGGVRHCNVLFLLVDVNFS